MNAPLQNTGRYANGTYTSASYNSDTYTIDGYTSDSYTINSYYLTTSACPPSAATIRGVHSSELRSRTAAATAASLPLLPPMPAVTSEAD
jgi:hypothetical protein